MDLKTFGYSQNHRPNLKQLMIYLMASHNKDVPLLQKTVAKKFIWQSFF
ncbi:MAG: hypothetical protein QRY72_00030 [Candidatus Rhabdochlamydia sp.]